MSSHITIEERLEIFAQRGMTHGFSLKLWPSKAKALRREGIVLSNPRPTGRRGEKRFDINFSNPTPGKFSETLFLMAMEEN